MQVIDHIQLAVCKLNQARIADNGSVLEREISTMHRRVNRTRANSETEDVSNKITSAAVFFFLCLM